jgi:hypothetical protein
MSKLGRHFQMVLKLSDDSSCVLTMISSIWPLNLVDLQNTKYDVKWRVVVKRGTIYQISQPCGVINAIVVPLSR